jgi:Tol biopolymer transport system component
MKKNILFFLFFVSKLCYSQNLATNPTKIKWSKVSTDHFKVIFPKGLDSIAIRTANQLESSYLPVSNSLGKLPRPISVVLQNQTTVSNGFVTFTPRHSEFNLTPPQDYTLLGTNNWLDLLAKHEFRHVVQQDKSISGLGKLFYTLFGNYGASGLSHVVMPAWYWEGDAVGIETSQSMSGRGAIPYFSILMRSQLADYNSPFSYSKATGRSFKHNIPNHYVLGYYMTNYMKEKYGFDVYDKLLTDVFKFPFYPFSFSNNVKKIAGTSVDNVYQNAFSDLKKDIIYNVENRKLYDVNYVNHSETRYYTDYEFPQQLTDGRILALKSGLSNIAQFVILDKNKGEEKVFEIGFLNDGFTISAAIDKVVWAEFVPDVRFGGRDFSNIKILDLNTKKTRFLTQKTRLAAPALSPNGRQIVAVNTSESGKHTMQLINAESGIVFKEFENRQNVFYQHPSWSADGKSLVTVVLQNNKKTIQLIDIETGSSTDLLPYENLNYGHPVLKDDLLMFNLAQKGIDNIFIFNLKTKQNYQVTNAKFGAFNGVFSNDGKEIIFTDFTSLGHRVAKIPLDFNSFLAVNELLAEKPQQFSNWMKNESELATKSVEKNEILAVKPFSKWNILNINSWGGIAGSDGTSASIGIDTQDLLSTTTASVGVGYNAAEQQSNYYANISYQGLFPVFDLNFENAGRQTVIPKGSIKDQTTDLVDNWRQQSVSLGVSLPLTFRVNKFTNNFSFGSRFTHTEGIGYDLKFGYTTQVGNKSVQSLTNYLSFNRQKKFAKRDAGSRWAQSALIYLRNTPFGNNLQSNLFAMQGSLTFPAFLKHDLIRFRANYIDNGINNEYYFSSPVVFPRGYEYNIFDKMTSFSADYKTPIADPDFALGRLLYFQRIKGGLFMDIGQGQFLDTNNKTQIQNFSSFGVDLSTIFTIMRFDVPIEMGVRFNYLPNTNQFLVTPLILDIPF